MFIKDDRMAGSQSDTLTVRSVKLNVAAADMFPSEPKTSRMQFLNLEAVIKYQNMEQNSEL